ncbi:hypothetical protein BY458DRAFT_495749 [Sporodiniella umbellata]|nr:hypothetical protein BY458DRAFT_495749 [Sporodiniella umbellata]
MSHDQTRMTFSSLPFQQLIFEKLKELLIPYGCTQIFHDQRYWYALFPSFSAAQKAQKSIHTIAGYRAEMELSKKDWDASDIDDLIDTLLEHVDDEEEEWINGMDVEFENEWNPFGQTKDAEDLKFLQIAMIEKVEPELRNELVQDLGGDEAAVPSARTKEYISAPDCSKTAACIQNRAIALDSKTNMINNARRRVVSNAPIQTKAMTESDTLKYNELKQKKRQLVFGKSSIHAYGLFSREKIDPQEFIIEYVGEVVHQQVAERREKEYEHLGIGNSYLFRVDDDTVIDATKKGGLARYINHCCTPNCSIKIITIGKQKKVIIYATQEINPGDEITYKSTFEMETIPCSCGSKFCKGSLN